jgi:hypothetical protein
MLLLEPSTEGRLAAFLARHGEGVAAVYVQAAGLADTGGESLPGRLFDGGSGRENGPLGAQRWLAGDRWGPWLIAVADEASVVARPDARDTIGT